VQHFRIYAVDIIGDPGFSATARPAYHTEDHALWLDDVFKSLDLRSADMVGASFGGWIALDFATRRPNAVSRLVLLAPAGIARPSFAATLEISTLMLMGAWGRRQALLRLFGLVNENLADDQEIFLAFGSLVQINALSRLKVPAPIPDEQLRNLSARTLTVLGGKDILFNADAVSRRLREVCPMITVQIIPDAGHALVDPTELVCGFLSGNVSS
jgi:pimeloyl-ACP methyl ester carboxylesterase